MKETPNFCRRMARREFLATVGGGFSSLALTGMLSHEGFFNSLSGSTLKGPLATKVPHFPAKAKRVIFLFMYGGPSHVDTFDYKPELFKFDGKTVKVNTFGRGGRKNEGRVVGPKWNFQRYGESGQWVSDLFPHLATCVDDITFLKSMTADSPIHGSAMLMMNSGSIVSGSPSLGSWVNYGLGTVNQDLPGYVVMLDQSVDRLVALKTGPAVICRPATRGPHFAVGVIPFSISKVSRTYPWLSSNASSRA